MPRLSTESRPTGRQGAAAALLLLCTLLAGGGLRAHPGHGADISREQAVERAATEIERLTAQGKLEKSWPIESRLVSAAVADRGNRPEWVVVFENRNAQTTSDRLYVFLSLTGEYLAANFTGR